MWIIGLIGLTGFAGTGKDTIADILVERYDYTKMSMADPIKRFCRDVLGFTKEQLWGPSELRNAPTELKRKDGELLTPRYALQTLGTEWGRNCYPDIWVDHAMITAEALIKDVWLNYTPEAGAFEVTKTTKPRGGVVIPDIRFKNEFNALRDHPDATIVKVMRPGVEAPPFAHQSEEEQLSFSDNDFDWVINNVGTLDDLHRAVTDLVHVLKSRS